MRSSSRGSQRTMVGSLSAECGAAAESGAGARPPLQAGASAHTRRQSNRSRGDIDR
jgi:hypothetical protein